MNLGLLSIYPTLFATKESRAAALVPQQARRPPPLARPVAARHVLCAAPSVPVENRHYQAPRGGIDAALHADRQLRACGCVHVVRRDGRNVSTLYGREGGGGGGCVPPRCSPSTESEHAF